MRPVSRIELDTLLTKSIKKTVENELSKCKVCGMDIELETYMLKGICGECGLEKIRCEIWDD